MRNIAGIIGGVAVPPRGRRTGVGQGRGRQEEGHRSGFTPAAT